MNKVEEIFTAWRIALTVAKDDPKYDLACKRIEICEGCEHKETVTLGNLDIFTRCNLCGCALKAKIFTVATHNNTPGGSCPKGKWSDVEDEYMNKNNDKQV